MTIKLTEDEYWEQFQAADAEELQWDAADELDIVEKFDARIAQGWWRTIWLREGIRIEINQAQHRERTVVGWPEQESRNIQACFVISGKLQATLMSSCSEVLLTHTVGKYFLRSNGLNHKSFSNCSDLKPYSELVIDIHPSILHSFVVSPEGELPKSLQHLIRPSSQSIYIRSSDIQPMMFPVLQQILHCPYQGFIKRAYLESKAIELTALVLDHEVTIRQGELQKDTLKPEQLERIHYAKELLLRDLSNPPSLEELARQSGLNQFTLNQGFRQTFGKSVFGELRSYRLEIAKQLLAEQDMSIVEVSHRIGYASVTSFYKAFKHQFSTTPKAYQKAFK